MAIQPEERFDNIKRALFDYIETNYTETAKWFQGSNVLDTTAITEWAWFGIIGVARRRPMRQVGSSNIANLVTLLVQAIIYVKPTATITRVDAIRDEIVGVLRKPAIQIVDRVGSAGNLGTLYGQDVVNEANLGIEDDLQMYQITLGFNFIEEFS
jgi:hypothetical protein